MYYATIKKIECLHNRALEASGLILDLPVVGNKFFMYLSKEDDRYLYTTPVQERRDVGDEIVFKTQDSTYVLSSVTRAIT